MAEDIARMEAYELTAPIPERKTPRRKPLPDHLPRHEMLREPKADGAAPIKACVPAGRRLLSGIDGAPVFDVVAGAAKLARQIRQTVD